MKKTLISLIVTMFIIGIVSCSKEDVPIPHEDGFAIQPVPSADGVFNPTMKISSIADEQNTETWTWGNDKLSEIHEKHAQYKFSYMGSQISQIIANGTLEDYDDLVTMTTNFSYNGDHLTQMVNEINDEPMLSMTLQHNANDKISHVDIEMNSTDLSNYIDDFISSIFPDKNNTKNFDFNSDNIYSDLNWNGNNMSQMIFTANGEIVIKIGELQGILNAIDDNNLGNYTEIINIINAIDPNREIPITLEISDTTDYTYDSYNNPYYGFFYCKLGATNVVLKGLSQNNILTSTSYGTINIVLDNPLIPGLSFNHSIPIPTKTKTYQYQYNANGFPIAITEKYKSYTITYSK